MNKPKTTQEAFDNFNNACREFARVVRKTLFCSRGIHWRMKYDGGLAHDYLGARSCQDCGYKKKTTMPPDMPKVKPPKVDNSDLNDLLIAATNPRYLKIGARYLGDGKYQGTINSIDSDLVSVEVGK